MIKVTVQIRDINRGTVINMDVEEYHEFIEKQAKLLGLITPVRHLIGLNTSKLFMDDILKDFIKKEKRGNKND